MGSYRPYTTSERPYDSQVPASVTHDPRSRNCPCCFPHSPRSARLPPQRDGALVARPGTTQQEHKGGPTTAIGGDCKHTVSDFAPTIRLWATLLPHFARTSCPYIHDLRAARIILSCTRYPQAPRIWLDTQFQLRWIACVG